MGFYKSFQDQLTGWQGYDGSQDGPFYDLSATIIEESSIYFDVAACSATLFVTAYSAGTNVLLTASSIAGTVITPGTQVTAYTSGGPGVNRVRVAALSATKIIVAWVSSSTLYVRTYTISGTTLTPDVSAVTIGSYGSACDVAGFTATRAVVVYGTGSGAEALGLTIGTGTVVLDAAAEVLTAVAAPNEISVNTFSSTLAIVGYVTASTTLRFRRLNDTGTDINKGNEATTGLVIGTFGIGLQVTPNATGDFFFSIGGTLDLTYVGFCTLSGSTITSPAYADIPPFSSSGYAFVQNQFSENYFVGGGMERGDSSSITTVVTSTGTTAGNSNIIATTGNGSNFSSDVLQQKCAALDTVSVVMVATGVGSDFIRAKIVHN